MAANVGKPQDQQDQDDERKTTPESQPGRWPADLSGEPESREEIDYPQKQETDPKKKEDSV